MTSSSSSAVQLLERSKKLASLSAVDAADAIGVVVAIKELLPSCGDPDVLRAVARALPSRVCDLSPEVCLAVAELALSLAPYEPRIPSDLRELAGSSSEGTPPDSGDVRLAVLWFRVRVASGDYTCLDAAKEDDDDVVDEAFLLHAVTDWSALDAAFAPLPLLERLTRANDARLRACALQWMRQAVQDLAITAQEAFACVALLAADVELPAIRCPALSLLGKCFMLGIAPASRLRREALVKAALGDASLSVRQAAIEATLDLGERKWLVDVIEDMDAPLSGRSFTSHRAELLEALGKVAEADDLDTAFALASVDSLQFAPRLRSFLLEAHRHGAFLRDQHLDAALALFDEHDAFTAEELVRVTHLARVKLIEKLHDLDVNDARWIRRASILSVSLGTGAPAVISKLLRETSDARIAARAVDAAGRSPEYIGDDDSLLRWLDVIPEAVIPVLRVKGSAAASIPRLRAIVVDPFTLRQLRALAMDVLWALTPDRATLLRELTKELGPFESGMLDSKHLSMRDSSAAELLATHPWSSIPEHEMEPLDQLKIYCESGDIRFLADVTRLFREAFRDYVRHALAGDFTIKRLLLPEIEQLVFRYARHLIKDGRSVRRWIENGPETGRDLVLLMLIDWLHEAPSDAICVALLEAVARHTPTGATLKLIEPFWRRGETNVKRAAIEAILTAGAEAQGLEMSLVKLAADASNPRILCQALAAVRTLRASWAEPIVRAALSRPEMAVKKEAADALAEIGNGSSVPTIVKWLASHDNESFRTGLLRALERSAGPAFVAVLVDAFNETSSENANARERELLSRALNKKMSLRVVLRLARSTLESHRALVDACIDGKISLTDATSDELAAQLHRARLRTVEMQLDPARRLRIEGFSPEAARELVIARTAPAKPTRRSYIEADVLAIVRSGFADWVSWLATTPEEPKQDALSLVLDAADKNHAEHLDVLMDLIVKKGDVPSHTVASFLERCVSLPNVALPKKIRALAILRALPLSPQLSGLRRYRLLGRLGAVRSLSDLELCLSECRVGPNVAQETETLLTEVFSIPPARRDDPPELVKMREEAHAFYRLEPGSEEATAWLVAMARARPLDMPLVPPQLSPPKKPPFKPETRADLDMLLATLEQSDVVQDRTRAAAHLMNWPDAAGVAWPRVLDAFLSGRVPELEATQMDRLASTMTATWPTAREHHARALLLVPRLNDMQARAFIPQWIAGWDRGEPRAAELLRATSQDRLFPFVVSRAKAGNLSLLRLLGPRSTLAMRSLIDVIAAKAPYEATRLRLEPKITDRGGVGGAVDASGDPVDPIEGKDLHALVLLIDTKGVDKGLAVRAIHALAENKERAIDPLIRYTVDRRPQVRSAALRALRTVSTREVTLEATAQALKMETRRDVVLGLMSSLGHGRHEPALLGLVERLTDRDYRIRQGAHDALRAWGRDVVPALRHAARKARPDRRAQFAALIAELE